MSDFVHLHVHGQYSLLDGLTKPEDAIAAVVADGQPGIALTDHGSLAGTMKMAQAAHQAGIAFWPGLEIYLAIGSRHERNHVMVPAEDDFDGSGGTDGRMKRKVYEHLTLIAGTTQGWQNLMLLADRTHDTFYQKPRADYQLLGEYAQGITFGTGCLGGPVAGQLLLNNPQQAESNLRQLLNIADPGHLFVEVMDHGIPGEHKVIGGLVELAHKYKLPVVATNDAHYAHEHDADHHDSWLCVAQSKGRKATLKSDPNRWRFQGGGYHLRTAQEMRHLFDNQPGTEHAVTNSLRITEGFDHNPVLAATPTHPRIPHYPIPDGHTLDTWYHERVRQGLVRRYGNRLPQNVRERARTEENIIREFGVQAYMLIKADVIAAERAAGGLTGAGRGSAAGSLHAYALGITEIDPLRHGLLFERFLNPTRRGLPDIDSDFQASRRDSVVLQAAETYGADRVARIGTFGQSWAKAALKQMGRVLEADQLANRLANTVPKTGDPKKNTISILMDPTHPEGSELRELVATVGQPAHTLLQAAQAVEGSAANETIHACGVLISDEPIPGTMPLRRSTHDENAFPVTEWDAGDVEAAGGVKFDFLAIKDLDVCADTIRSVEETTGEHIDFYALDADLDDERSQRTKLMLAQGRTAGVFQIAGTGISELTRDIRPDSASDLAAILALYRPGPMGADQHNLYARRRRGGEPVDYGVFTMVAEEQQVIAASLNKTLGTIVYQEQLQTLARDIADFVGGQMADLQKAFSKKKQHMMDSLKDVWMSGGQAAVRADGTPKVAFQPATLERLWRAFEASGSYLFNASHAYAYAKLTWQTAYLKANWPAHYGAALLANTDKDDKRQQVLQSLVAEGVTVLPPSVVSGRVETSATPNGHIVLGLSEIKGVGQAGADIVQARNEGGPFTSLHDLVARTGITSLAVQALAEAGALDEFGPRLGITMVSRVLRVAGTQTPNTEWGVLERDTRQRLRLGLSVGDHPFLTPTINQQAHTHTTDFRHSENVVRLEELPHQQWAKVDTAGVVAKADEFVGRAGRRLSMVVDSPHTSVELVMWPNEYAKYRDTHPTPRVGQILAIMGSVRVQTPVTEDESDNVVAEPVLSLVAERLTPINPPDPDTPLTPTPQTILEVHLDEDPILPHTTPPPAPPPPPAGQDGLFTEPDTPPVRPLGEVVVTVPPVGVPDRSLQGRFAGHFGALSVRARPQMHEAKAWFLGAREGDEHRIELPGVGAEIVLLATREGGPPPGFELKQVVQRLNMQVRAS